MKREKTIYTIGAIVSSLLLFLAVGDHPYSYFTTLRWITCAVSVYGAYLSYKGERLYVVISLGVIAVLFNPIIPIHMGKSTWQLIDIVVGLIMLISPIFIWKRNASIPTDNQGL